MNQRASTASTPTKNPTPTYPHHPPTARLSGLDFLHGSNLGAVATSLLASPSECLKVKGSRWDLLLKLSGISASDNRCLVFLGYLTHYPLACLLVYQLHIRDLSIE